VLLFSVLIDTGKFQQSVSLWYACIKRSAIVRLSAGKRQNRCVNVVAG